MIIRVCDMCGARLVADPSASDKAQIRIQVGYPYEPLTPIQRSPVLSPSLDLCEDCYKLFLKIVNRAHSDQSYYATENKA